MVCIVVEPDMVSQYGCSDIEAVRSGSFYGAPCLALTQGVGLGCLAARWFLQKVSLIGS